jgi:hypothetical protein
MTSASCGGLATSIRWCIRDPNLLTQGDVQGAGCGPSQPAPFSFHLTSDRLVVATTYPRDTTGRNRTDQTELDCYCRLYTSTRAVPVMPLALVTMAV